MARTFGAAGTRAFWEKLPRRTKQLLLGAVAALALWLGLTAFVLPQRAARLLVDQELQTLRSGVETLRQQVAAQLGGARGEDTLRAEVTTTRDRLDEMLARVPEDRSLSSTLRDLTAPADGDGVAVVSITPQPPEKRGELLELPFTLELEGTYRALCRYLGRLERLPRLVSVQRVSLESPPAGKARDLRATIAAATYISGKNP